MGPAAQEVPLRYVELELKSGATTEPKAVRKMDETKPTAEERRKIKDAELETRAQAKAKVKKKTSLIPESEVRPPEQRAVEQSATPKSGNRTSTPVSNLAAYPVHLLQQVRQRARKIFHLAKRKASLGKKRRDDAWLDAAVVDAKRERFLSRTLRL